ncbi:hypothetical protein [Mycolicibacterium rhodesiae]|uniref:Uncharacterized protein n=1 Tax=Mycolicibacterium rhodesiae TaxID=36814 RepID=A0A1X0J2K4_MYCRH|nr:hypothetical protein [Mycolicibacterium rhodesiae]MCV7347089.1 hypothetical protein [Mycolicibacterium rhodesiae]ORB56012.1 hypothetical protein BST42_06395 [Mycolicibacterium rhodesiae]
MAELMAELTWLDAELTPLEIELPMPGAVVVTESPGLAGPLSLSLLLQAPTVTIAKAAATPADAVRKRVDTFDFMDSSPIP